MSDIRTPWSEERQERYDAIAASLGASTNPYLNSFAIHGEVMKILDAECSQVDRNEWTEQFEPFGNRY